MIPLGSCTMKLNAAAVSRNMLGVLGLEPQLGRGFTADEDRPGGPDAVMLTDRVWRESFGADRGVVGRTLVVDDRPHEVVGVLRKAVKMRREAAEQYDSGGAANRADAERAELAVQELMDKRAPERRPFLG